MYDQYSGPFPDFNSFEPTYDQLIEHGASLMVQNRGS
jgi:hypothetical protein